MTWTLRIALALLVAAAAAPAQTVTTTNPHGPNIGACAACHGAEGWKPARISRDFVHAPRTFPLDGAHARTACTSCHVSLDFAKAKPACAQCHRDVHAAELGTDCARCHSTRSFADQANLKRMHELTRFPLRGAHAALACVACHAPAQPGQSQYVRRPTACIGCHATTVRGVKDPDHLTAGFALDCTQCHSMSSWRSARFDHSATRFALTGAHRAAPCVSCHTNGVYRSLNSACASCHQSAYNASTRPPHMQLALPTICANCHTTTAWAGGTFDHSVTRFALTGAHRTVSCTGCHGDGIYRGKTMVCAGCHQARFDATTNPNHRAAAFPTTCESCHGTSAWTPSTFSHATTRFPLTGAHVAVACASCHGDGVYRGKTMVCSGCHLAQYNGTTNPNHKAAAFPTLCESCHTTARWTGATLNHDGTYFPIYSGTHKGRWSTCADCHTSSTNYAVFSCFSCHRQSDMDAKHRGRTGYRYDSALCYQCHPTGRAG